MLNRVLRAAVLLISGSLVIAGCVTTRPTPSKKPAVPTVAYEPGQWSDLPGWNTDNVQEAWQAFLQLPLSADEFRTIAQNVAPYLR